MEHTLDLLLDCAADVVHVHFHLSDNTAVLDRLTQMEQTMTDLTGAVSDNTAAQSEAADRINADVAHLQQLVTEALATDVANAAEVQRLTDAATAAVTQITANTAKLRATDPLPDFPAATPPTDQPPTDQPPTV